MNVLNLAQTYRRISQKYMYITQKRKRLPIHATPDDRRLANITPFKDCDEISTEFS